MTKSRDILKGKVKRLLREQDDMGQLCDPAVLHCVSALEAFMHDLGRRMATKAESADVAAITPIELKRCVLESDDLSFLHDKVHAIDESDAKYHKPTTTRKRKAPAEKNETSTAKGTAKKKTTTKASSGKAKGSAAATVSAAPLESTHIHHPPTAAIEEDDNYDSSDSD